MSKLTRDMVVLILQFFEEEGFKDAARVLERESGFYFKMDYFEEMILTGNWEEAEKYVSGFTKLDDNKYSKKIYFEMRKQNFLEVLDKGDRARALDILIKDLKVFEQHNKEVIRGMHELLTLKDIRDHNELSTYRRDTKSVRESLMHELRKLINANPLFYGKLERPSIQNKRLTCLINQSLNWQHMNCQNPQANPVISTLFTDHACPPPGDHSPSNNNDQLPSQTISMSVPTSSSSSESTPSTESTHSSGAFSWLLVNATTDDVEVTLTVPQNKPSDISDGETSTITDHGPSTFIVPGDLPAVMHPDQELSSITNLLLKDPPKDSVLESYESISSGSLPMAVGGILKEDSSPTCMDFHPIIPTTLLVGTVVGDIGLWDVSSRKKLLSRNFKVWDIEKCSRKFKAALLKDPHVSVNSIVWSPDGCLFGVGYSKHIVQIYNYHVGDEARQKLEIDAHVGGVNDLAFSVPEKQLLVLTCGDDKTVKAWDATTGVKLYTFEGHDAPVYSLCPHSKASIHFIFSVSVDGNIKAWLYDNLRARVDLYAPGLGCTSMAYTAGDRRLFSCGTSKCGESFLVEWDENEGSIIKTYQGLQKTSSSVVHFDILKNQFLAAGDEHQIKIWDMDRTELLTTINAGDELPANPRIQFNKDGTLLAAFAKENSIKILSTDFQLLPTSDTCSFASTGVLSDTFMENRNKENLEGVKSKFTRDTNLPKDCKLFEINRPSQCQTLWLPSHEKVHKISRLSYNHAGNAILALASNSTHLFWKWSCDDLNLSGKATTKTSPQLWQPRNCLGLMTNDLSHANSEEAVPCFALSKNDCYLVSASGGKISLYNMLTFKTMVTFMPPSPATTCLAFYPLDNNIIAIGRDDSTIIIYNVRVAEVVCKLRGHSKSVCALAFSSALNVLVSSGADGEIFVWGTELWEKNETCVLPIPGGKKSAALSNSYIQFHQDQKHILAVHETLLAVYKTNNLECVKQWTPKDSLPITGATFSCDSQMVYASFADGTICTFDASNLVLSCCIITAAYVPPSSSCDVYPVAIVAHPQKPNQFAVGLSDGQVAVLEPLNPAGKWIMFPTDEDESVDKLPSVDCFEDLSWLKEWSTKK